MVVILLLLAMVWSAEPGFSAGFELTSPVIKPGGKISEEQVFAGFGCNGQNISPELSWANAPKGTKSFAVTVYDPDAPTGSGWWHWIVFNIPASVTTLKAGSGKSDGSAIPAGAVQSKTDFGQPGYGGPCPPAGAPPHRYIFTVYALKVEQLPLKEDASGAMVGFYLQQQRLADASLTAYYGR